MKAYFGSNRRNNVFKRIKHILNLTEAFYAFWKRKRILEVLHGLRVILRETIGALLQINLAKGYMMRTSPRWTHRRHGLPQVAIRSQLSYHVALRFSRHVVTVSVITFSYDIEMGRSWMRWKGDVDAVVLDLVLAPEGPWIILCDHGKVLRHLFGPTWPLSCRALSPSCGRPTPGRPQP